MRVKVTNIYTDETETFDGEAPAVAHDIAMAFPWLQEYNVRLTDVRDVLQELELNQALVVEVGDDPIVKSEGSGSTTAKDMLGYDIFRERMFDAARWLSGFKEPKPESEVRNLMLEHDGDLESVALLTYGLEDNDRNRTALQAVQQMEKLGKAEAPEVVPPHSIAPGTDTAYNVCQAVKRAFQEHHVKPIQLGGKHSKGSMLAKDGDKSYILKAGSGGQSPAAGAQEEIASQGRREAAFYQVAKAWGMAAFFPAAEFLVMDGHDWATLEMLDFSYKNLEKERTKEPQTVHKALEAYRLRGVLHRWSVLDYVLGNPDRHAANLMLNPQGTIKLIDHGAAFAGEHFSPGHDADSFVPFYLRYLAGDSFYEMDPEMRLETMPHLPKDHDQVLAQWVHELDQETLRYLLMKYGINPEPSMDRLKEILALDTKESISDQLNQLWLGT